ncbi:hypothetical protein C8A01DRAFT_42696 [Parachaetomium inaequale]|uniref:Uncharacterized protein n=1 Tax=Parachaetomium inaequale TaxID=2588326 RepID=A0AAN6PNW5_9PEZI|nr:hypothetical protein C8A01DRAFT_42696 [Parachaetomium inaequale]
MSSDALPINPARFAAALKDLPISTLHLKVLELRNSITHLDYSNEQLRPFADGTATALSPTTTSPSTQPQATQGTPDQDCVDAIRENEAVIERMQARIRLVRDEVESRGLSWTEFQSQAERDAEQQAQQEQKQQDGVEGGGVEGMVNGAVVNGGSSTGATTTAVNGERLQQQRQQHSAWTDGTFQTGVIRGGVVQMDDAAAGQGQGQQQGGSLTDEELRRRVEEQLRGLGGGEDEDEGEGGLHL